MPEPLVDARGISRTYETHGVALTALLPATFSVLPGARIALMGPSGSGKSTLLHLVSGLDAPTGGSIDWPAMGPRESLLPAKIAMIFQNQSLLPSLNVVENVEIPLLLAGVAASRAHAAALNALSRIDLADIADKLPEDLSGGQAQRVAVARALAFKPRLILADEPTGQLDHATAGHLFEVLLASLEGSDTALVVATHDPSVSRRMDQVWHIQHGKLEPGSGA